MREMRGLCIGGPHDGETHLEREAYGEILTLQKLTTVPSMRFPATDPGDRIVGAIERHTYSWELFNAGPSTLALFWRHESIPREQIIDHLVDGYRKPRHGHAALPRGFCSMLELMLRMDNVPPDVAITMSGWLHDIEAQKQ
jgi:hypothetical protein